jgi:hypothetical protein
MTCCGHGFEKYTERHVSTSAPGGIEPLVLYHVPLLTLAWDPGGLRIRLLSCNTVHLTRILTVKHLGVRVAAATAFLSPLYRMNLTRKAVAAATRTPRLVSLALKFRVLEDS